MTIIKNFEPEKEERKIFLPKKIIVLGGFFIVLVVAEIWVSHTVVSFSQELKKIDQLKDDLSFENQLLENEIAKLSSLTSIATSSASLGFIKPKQVKYIR